MESEASNKCPTDTTSRSLSFLQHFLDHILRFKLSRSCARVVLSSSIAANLTMASFSLP